MKDKLMTLLVIQEEEKIISRRKIKCVVFYRDEFLNTKLYASIKQVVVTEKGPDVEFFVLVVDKSKEESEEDKQKKIT